MRILAACFAFALGLALPAPLRAAAAPKSFDAPTKVGKSNVRVRVILHPQADKCSPAQVELIRGKAVALGEAHMRAHLKEVIAKSRTDASGAGEFFGVSFLAGCPDDGGAWVAFPADKPEKSVTRYSKGEGWSPMAPL